MPPIILVLLQALFLILLYVFVARAVRAVVRDVNRAAAPVRAPAPAAARPRGPSRPTAPTSRRTRGQARQLVVHAPDGRPDVVPLDGTEITFGRGESCTVTLKDTYASERHANVYPAGDEWLVSDLGSTNGTFLNKAKVTGPTPIQPGDQLGIGKTVVEVRK